MRYLGIEEKDRCRVLWREAFAEDSTEFVDYYFEEKTKDNRILVREEEGQIISMAHLNPYLVQSGGNLWETDYIVGVATRADRRGRGHMRAVMNRALQDMYETGRMFTFLMPAAEAIYRPFDFVYIFDQPDWSLKEGCGLTRRLCTDAPEDLELAAAYTNRWLKKRYQVFCRRDPIYMKRMLKELGSERGQMDFLYNGERLAGLWSDWGLNRREQRQLLCEDEFRAANGPVKPAIMARIVNLQRLAGALKLKPDSSYERLDVMLNITDPVLEENCGLFLWRFERDRSWLERVRGAAFGVPGVSGAAGGAGTFSGAFGGSALSVGELTAWVFGYGPDGGVKQEWQREVKTLGAVFLDEMV